jgi:uncharacterized OB-fold protein
MRTNRTYRRPVPDLSDALWTAFYRHCAAGELRFQRCASCRQWRHRPRLICSACQSDQWTWELSTGHGRVYTWTIVHQALHPAFASDVPYAVVVGEMDEQVRLVARLEGWDRERTPLSLDLPMQVKFEPIENDIALPVFELEPAPSI